MSDGEIIAVLDAGPLIHLDEIESLHLLSGFRQILLPPIVEREATRHRPGIKLDSVPSLLRVAPDAIIARSLRAIAGDFGLHAGELEALAVLKERAGDFLLSDDTAARAMAEAMGFEVRGTVGLILRAWARAQIAKPEARQLLSALPQKSTLHLRREFLDSVLSALND